MARAVGEVELSEEKRKSRRRLKESFKQVAERRHQRGSNAKNGLPRQRKTNGSWPAEDVAPKPPLFGNLHEDLAENLPQAVFGQYSKGLIGKLLPWLRCERNQILHVCSGALRPGEGIRVDVRPEAKPDILADGRALPLADNCMDAVLIDPPYTEQYAQDLYGVEYPRPAHLLKEAARVVKPDGRIGFVHYLVPMPPPNTRLVKVLGLSSGLGFSMRAVTIYQKEQEGLFK